MKNRFECLIRGLREAGDDVLVITPDANPPKEYCGAKVRHGGRVPGAVARLWHTVCEVHGQQQTAAGTGGMDCPLGLRSWACMIFASVQALDTGVYRGMIRSTHVRSCGGGLVVCM